MPNGEPSAMWWGHVWHGRPRGLRQRESGRMFPLTQIACHRARCAGTLLSSLTTWPNNCSRLLSIIFCIWGSSAWVTSTGDKELIEICCFATEYSLVEFSLFLLTVHLEEALRREFTRSFSVWSALPAWTWRTAVVRYWRTAINWRCWSAGGLRTRTADWTPQWASSSTTVVGWRETVSAVLRWVAEETSCTDTGKHAVILLLQAEQSCDVIVKPVCFEQSDLLLCRIL